MAIGEIKALIFDVFGTVVDYRSTIMHEGEQLSQQKGLTVDWDEFSYAWRSRYQPILERVERHELPWTKLDTLHRMALDEVLAEFQVTGLTEDEKVHLNRVWHRLQPWPDSVAGLTRLRQKFVLATLSNGNVSLLTNMAKYSGLPWDCILSAELVRAYKPNPAVYQMASELLDLPAQQIMLVAAHPYDLEAAHAQGMRTTLVPRPLESGPKHPINYPANPDFDFVASDMLDLARQLGT
ncbi:MAG: haloacid dehalogenase type II [Chloroflexota bacterium]|nr:haloacid dehalogenase type II [Chloroflexota bacterium]